MTNSETREERDKILFAFHRECASPSLADILHWTTLYPEFAEDIRSHAAIMREWAAGEGETFTDADYSLMARGRSRALNAVYQARKEAAASTSEAASATFDQLMEARGVTTAQLADTLDIKRSILSDLFRGRMLVPIGQRLVDACMQQLRISRDAFDRAVEQALASPSMGYAKAKGPPTVVRASYEDIIRQSSMSAERQSYWLGED